MSVLQVLNISTLAVLFVFLVVVALLIVIIILLSKLISLVPEIGKKETVFYQSEKPAPSYPVSQNAALSRAAAPNLPESAGIVNLNNVDDKTAAMLMAIVCEKLKTPINQLRFISIKEIN